MPSITTWTRLEPICRDDDIGPALEARVQDPLWLLGRQWQLNEFKGEDAGSPVTARVASAAYQLSRYATGAPTNPDGSPRPGERFDPMRVPLETRVERETMATAPEPGLRFALDAGRQFLRFLDAAGAGAKRTKYLSEFAVQLPEVAQAARLDVESGRLFAAAAGRAIDGTRLFREFKKRLPEEEPDAAAAKRWLAWYRSVYSEPTSSDSAWVDERMEYRFAVSARSPGGEIVLEANEYSEGRLDWYDFALRSDVSLGATEAEAAVEAREDFVIPSPVSYPGMPAERWWQFEDARIHFGAVDVQPGDLVTTTLVQFALIYGNDWFVVPVSARVGSVCEVQALEVTDSFGVRADVAPFSRAHPNWRLFALTQPSVSARELFFLPPVLAQTFVGAPLEEVLFARDEGANLVWAIERQVENPSGTVIDRRWHSPPVPTPEVLPPGDPLRYRLISRPPENWVPLVPMRHAAGGEPRFHRALLEKPALGRLVGAPDSLSLLSSEVPRSGVVVTRTPQWSRWIDGSTHLWVGRRKLPGSGEASSGMRFDYLEGPPEQT